VSIPEASRLLRVSENTVRRRLKSGELKGHQVASVGGFAWVVEISDDLAQDASESREMAEMRASMGRMEAQIASLEGQLQVKDQQIEQLHVLLQQAQAALPAPREGKSWWRWWSR
jgi:excisionase family DNA binding protein